MFGLLVIDRLDGVAVKAQDRRIGIAHDDRRMSGDDHLGVAGSLPVPYQRNREWLEMVI